MPPSEQAGTRGLSASQRFLKRSFDLVFAGTVVVVFFPVMAVALIAATLDTRQNGLFSQVRIGRGGRAFRAYKIRTMRASPTVSTTVTTRLDPRITVLGRCLRKTKIDELPQFINVLLGDMSVVGPRPDVPGYADRLAGDDSIVLSVRPGITGPATLFFRDEEALLAAQPDPERFNREWLWPAKICMNADYVRSYNFCEDLRLVLDTSLPFLTLSKASRARRQLEPLDFTQPLDLTPH